MGQDRTAICAVSCFVGDDAHAVVVSVLATATASAQPLDAPFSFNGFAASLDVRTVAFGQVGLGTAFMVVMIEAEMGEHLYSRAVNSLVRYIPSVLV